VAFQIAAQTILTSSEDCLTATPLDISIHHLHPPFYHVLKQNVCFCRRQQISSKPFSLLLLYYKCTINCSAQVLSLTEIKYQVGRDWGSILDFSSLTLWDIHENHEQISVESQLKQTHPGSVYMETSTHQQLIFYRNPSTGKCAIVANTALIRSASLSREVLVYFTHGKEHAK
jgi:hypothetical protein